MTLTTKCKACPEFIKLKFRVIDRVDLVQEKGENIPITCDHCHQKNEYHVNEIKASGNKNLQLIFLLVLIISTTVIIYFFRQQLFSLPAIFLIPSPTLIYFLLVKNDIDNRKRFNRHHY